MGARQPAGRRANANRLSGQPAAAPLMSSPGGLGLRSGQEVAAAAAVAESRRKGNFRPPPTRRKSSPSGNAASINGLQAPHNGQKAKAIGRDKQAASRHEQRKRSLQESNVFIYPTQYEHLNRCQKCARDNRVCSCTSLESASRKSSALQSAAAATATAALHSDRTSTPGKELDPNDGRSSSAAPEGRAERTRSLIQEAAAPLGRAGGLSNASQLHQRATTSQESLKSIISLGQQAEFKANGDNHLPSQGRVRRTCPWHCAGKKEVISEKSRSSFDRSLERQTGKDEHRLNTAAVRDEGRAAGRGTGAGAGAEPVRRSGASGDARRLSWSGASLKADPDEPSRALGEPHKSCALLGVPSERIVLELAEAARAGRKLSPLFKAHYEAPLDSQRLSSLNARVSPCHKSQSALGQVSSARTNGEPNLSNDKPICNCDNYNGDEKNKSSDSNNNDNNNNNNNNSSNEDKLDMDKEAGNNLVGRGKVALAREGDAIQVTENWVSAAALALAPEVNSNNKRPFSKESYGGGATSCESQAKNFHAQDGAASGQFAEFAANSSMFGASAAQNTALINGQSASHFNAKENCENPNYSKSLLNHNDATTNDIRIETNLKPPSSKETNSHRRTNEANISKISLGVTGGESIKEVNNNSFGWMQSEKTLQEKSLTSIDALNNQDDETSSRQRLVEPDDDYVKPLAICSQSKQHFHFSGQFKAASIRLGLNKENVDKQQDCWSSNSNSSHTTIVPIQTLCTRRRGAAQKLIRQSSREDILDTMNQQRTTSLMLMASNPICERRFSQLDGTLTSSTSNVSHSINELPIQDKREDALEYSPILSSAQEYINTVNTEIKVQQEAASCNPLLAAEGCIEFSSNTASNILNHTTLNDGPITLTTSSLDSNHIALTDGSCVINGDPINMTDPDMSDSLLSKKSIFDGASKDEILEYLEDARERVPEILMATNDDIVINDSELVVVDSIQPTIEDADASIPLSESSENSMLSANISLEDSSENQQIVVDRTVVSDLTESEKLQKHLKQVYKTTKLSSSEFGSDLNSLDNELANITINTEDDRDKLKSLISSVSITHDSEILGALEIQPPKSGLFTNDTQCLLSSLSTPDGQTNLRDETNGDLAHRQNMIMTISSFSRTDLAERDVISSSSMQGRNNIPANQYHPTRRRNSSAETTKSIVERNSLSSQKVTFQQHSTRDSLGSSSSSPSSSISPSSNDSSSSTQTGSSGIVSSFYASSSLSSSSPLLVIANSQTGSNRVMNSFDTNDSQLLKPIHSTALTTSDNYLKRQVERDDSGLGMDLLGHPSQMPDPASIGTHKQIVKQDQENISGRLDVIEEIVTRNNMNGFITNMNASNKQSIAKYAPQVQSKDMIHRPTHGHYTTLSRLNNYLLNRQQYAQSTLDTNFKFQCLDCDQFIDVDRETIQNKTDEARSIIESDMYLNKLIMKNNNTDSSASPDLLDRAYIAAMNGLPLCKSCDKKRVERKEIISEFVETEIKYGRDLKIIRDEFYRPIQTAALLTKDQINGVFLNLEELIMANTKFCERLEKSIKEAYTIGDSDYNSVNIGKMFVESADMLNIFEAYCIRQGAAACLLDRLAKEKELLRVFLGVSQIENPLLRRMGISAFLMIPVQRITKFPLLLNRLYKHTATYHRDREFLRDAQLRVELHLEHINQQTKGSGPTSRIWRRISNLSAPAIANRRGLINAEDIVHIKLRKASMDILNWDRDETKFIHSGKLNFASFNEFLTRQKAKQLRHTAAHALLVVLGKPNWKYRPDMVKANLDSKLMTATPGGTGIKEAALLLFREKNGRFTPCREPLFLSNCVLSKDCSQYNSEYPPSQQTSTQQRSMPANSNQHSQSSQTNTSTFCDRKLNSHQTNDRRDQTGNESRVIGANKEDAIVGGCQLNFQNGDAISMSSIKSLPESQSKSSSPPIHTSRSHSLALPNTVIPTATSAAAAAAAVAAAAASSSTISNGAAGMITFTSSSKSMSNPVSSNGTILNQLITKVNSYHHNRQGSSIPKGEQNNLKSNSLNTSSGNNAITRSTSSYQNQQSDLNIANQVGRDLSKKTNVAFQNNHSSQNQGSSAHGAISNGEIHQLNYNHHFFHNHHQPYGDYEESFEIHDRLTKESILLRADTHLKTRYWLQMLRYHAKDLGAWRARRNGLANLMMMRYD